MIITDGSHQSCMTRTWTPNRRPCLRVFLLCNVLSNYSVKRLIPSVSRGHHAFSSPDTLSLLIYFSSFRASSPRIFHARMSMYSLHQFFKASSGPLGFHNGCLFCVLFPQCGLSFSPCLCVFFSFYWERKRFCFVCVLGYSPTWLPVFMLYFYVLFVFMLYLL